MPNTLILSWTTKSCENYFAQHKSYVQNLFFHFLRRQCLCLLSILRSYIPGPVPLIAPHITCKMEYEYKDREQWKPMLLSTDEHKRTWFCRYSSFHLGFNNSNRVAPTGTTWHNWTPLCGVQLWKVSTLFSKNTPQHSSFSRGKHQKHFTFHSKQCHGATAFTTAHPKQVPITLAH